jgi:hypothetical protein
VPNPGPHAFRGLPPPSRRTGRRATHDVDRRDLAGGVRRGEPADHGEAPSDDEVGGLALDERGGQVTRGDGRVLRGGAQHPHPDDGGVAAESREDPGVTTHFDVEGGESVLFDQVVEGRVLRLPEAPGT